MIVFKKKKAKDINTHKKKFQNTTIFLMLNGGYTKVTKYMKVKQTVIYKKEITEKIKFTVNILHSQITGLT